MIEKVEVVQGLELCADAELTSALAEAKNLNVQAIVTATYDIYYVAPATAPAAVAFSKLSRKVRQFGPGKALEISPAVFESWQQEGRTSDSKPEAKKEANRVVEGVLNSACEAGASDVHIIVSDKAVVHYRIHGILVPRQEMTAKVGRAMVASLFQHYAGVGYGEREEARDGKFYHTATSDKRSYLVRLNKLTTVDQGLTCKLRLRQTDERVDITTAGYNEHQLTMFRRMMASGTGLLIITGPVNSGKSTTMTALLRSIPSYFSVLEISDTVEVRLDNVCHVELPSDGDDVDKRIAAIQDAVVRQDSDYLAIGEIRNRVTAAQAEIMGLQGKFVLSTGHAADAIAFFQRMTSPDDFGMSVNTVLGPDFVRGLVSQALVETLCPHCSNEAPEPDAAARTDHASPQAVAEYYRSGIGEGVRYHNSQGCERCDHTGLTGRTILAEVVPFDQSLRELLRRGDFNAVRPWMAEQGIETKHEHGLPKVLAGHIDPLHLARRIDALSPTTITNWGSDRSISYIRQDACA